MNIEIIKAAGARRQGRTGKAGNAPGARLPVSLAGAPVEARTLSRVGADGEREPITPLGYKTAVRSMGRTLGALSDTDPRLRAALTLADASERLGSMSGSGGVSEASAPKSGQSDGGATIKIHHAAKLRRIEALINRWDIQANGRIVCGRDRIALPIGRQTGKLKEIKAFDALVAMCVDGLSADEILRRHGWRAKSKARGNLIAAMLSALDDVADGLGFGRSDRKND